MLVSTVVPPATRRPAMKTLLAALLLTGVRAASQGSRSRDRHRRSPRTAGRRFSRGEAFRRGSAAAPSARAAGDRAQDRRPVGRKRLRLPERVPGRQALPHVLPRRALSARRQAGRDQARPPLVPLLRRERRRHPLAPAGAGPVRVRRLQEEQHHPHARERGRDPRRSGPYGRLQGRQSRLPGRRALQVRHRRQAPRAVRAQVGRRHPLQRRRATSP